MAAPTAAEKGTAANGTSARTWLRREQRRCYVHTLRQQLQKVGARLSETEAKCQALMEGSSGDSRERAAVAALRLHRAACKQTGRDDHCTRRALWQAGWWNDTTQQVVLRGNVARHHALASMSDANL